jgi:hypothetical protein
MRQLILAAIFILIGKLTFAQSDSSHSKPIKKWSIEVELVQPFIPTVEIWTIQATRNLFTNRLQKGEIVLGAYIRPNVTHDVVEKIDEYMLYTAYRHYFWKGLHIEAGMNTGYYWGKKNLVNGKDYEGLALFWESNIGYKLNLGKTKRFFVNPQFGFLGTMGIADIGPRQGKPDNFVQGNLLIGFNF